MESCVLDVERTGASGLNGIGLSAPQRHRDDGVLALEGMKPGSKTGARLAGRGSTKPSASRGGWLLMFGLAACSADDEGGQLGDSTAGQQPATPTSTPTTLPMSAPPPPVRMPDETVPMGGAAGGGAPGISEQPPPGSTGGSSPDSEVDVETSDDTGGESMTSGVGGTSSVDTTEDSTERTRPGGGRPGRTEETSETSTDEATTTPEPTITDVGSGMSSEPSHDGAETGRMAGMTAAHNAVREAVSMQSLPPLTWSETIAEYAQEWADELAKDCMPRHRSNLSYGENIATFGSTAAGGPGTTAADAVDGWAAEIDCWEYGEFMRTDSCDAQCVAQLNASGCGHYTQLVWSSTEEVGCGLSQCSRSQGGPTFQFDIWVCNYDPPGNFVGRNPY